MSSRNDKEAVESQYSSKKEVALHERHGKPNWSFSVLSNWVKSILIQNLANLDATSVLDLGCGKGSDAHKFSFVSTRHYLGIDFCGASIAAGQARLKAANTRRKSEIQSSLVVADFTKLDEMKLGKFSAVSAFFSFHYCFESTELALGLLKAVNHHLGAGGLFIGIVPDGDKIYEELKEGRRHVSYQIELGPSVLRSDFGESGSGQRYLFSLHSSFQHLPEHALPFELFVSCAESAGFQLLESDNFKSIYQSSESDHGLLSKMNRGQKLLLSDEQLELADLYRTFVFKKV